MKHIYFLLILITLFSCENKDGIENSDKRNENWCWFIDETTGVGEWIPIKDQTSKIEGDFTLFYCNGNISQKGKVKDGEKIDTLYKYDLNGRLIFKFYLSENKDPEKFILYDNFESHYTNCKIAQRATSKNGIKTKMTYHENELLESYFYKDSLKYFKTSFNELGQKKDSIYIDIASQSSFSYKWYDNEKLKSVLSTKNNLQSLNTKTYFENGQIEDEIAFFNSIGDSLKLDWKQEKQIFRRLKIGTDTSDYCFSGKSRSWYRNGDIRTIQTIKNNKSNGDYETYYLGKILDQKGQFKNGKEVGLWKYNYKNGEPQAIGVFFNGKKTGIWKCYDEFGKENTQEYLNDKEHGLWKYYHKNGELQAIGKYNNGNEIGLWKFYYDDGTQEAIGKYKNGEKTGVWKYSDESGEFKSEKTY